MPAHSDVRLKMHAFLQGSPFAPHQETCGGRPEARDAQTRIAPVCVNEGMN